MNTAGIMSDPKRLPQFSQLSSEAITTALDEALQRHRSTVRALILQASSDFSDTWLPYERAGLELEAIWSAASHLQAVADTPELRGAHAAGQEALVENEINVGQNRQFFDLLVGMSLSPAFATLADADRMAVEKAIRDFTLAGVALEPGDRERFKAVSIELSNVSREFRNAVLDATDSWTELITDEMRLAGIPETSKAMFLEGAIAAGKQGWLITLRQPSVAAVMTFGEDRDLRARVYLANGTRASDQGPDAGTFDNSQRITRILELRREGAALLGFTDPVDWSFATKMASNAGEVLTFLRDLARRAKPAALQDIETLRLFAAEHLGIPDLQPWDVPYASNRLRISRHAVDEEIVRAHFPIDRVMTGWKTLLDQLFGIRLVERSDVDLWHDDAAYFDVIDRDDTVIAGLYVDLYARSGKNGGAWMAPARPRLSMESGSRVPVAYLVCNFAPPSADTPALLSHNDVSTLLHETGHCLHHLFTRVDRPSIAGINGFEWDAVELPSQLMEDFAWDRDVLTSMSGHHGTGEPLPADLFDKMADARHFQAGMFIVRQVEFALFDLLLHGGTIGSDPMEVIEAVRDEVAVLRPPKWHRFPHAFSHIFAGGYASGYYSYLWAELLAADGFLAFVEAGTVDQATGQRFRDEVLARGATRSAAESFRAFRGRDPQPEAMLARHGLH